MIEGKDLLQMTAQIKTDIPGNPTEELPFISSKPTLNLMSAINENYIGKKIADLIHYIDNHWNEIEESSLQIIPLQNVFIASEYYKRYRILFENNATRKEFQIKLDCLMDDFDKGRLYTKL